MSSEPSAEPGESAVQRGTMRFRKRSNAAVLSPESVKRQGAITSLAFQMIGREHAIAFLNADHPQLAGRPLDIAVASREGLEQVTAELKRVAALAPEAE